MAVLSNKGKRIDELKSLDAGTLANSDLLVVQDVQPTPTTKNITYANLRDKISSDIQASTLSLDNVTSISASKINVNSNGTFGTLRVLGTVSMPNTVSMATANITDATITTQNVGASTITRLNCNSITGSLKGTGSWSRRSITASHALIAATTIVCQTSTTTADTASFLVYTGTPNGTASYSIKNISSSYSFRAVSSSYSSYALNSNSSQIAQNSVNSTQANNAYTASYIKYDALVSNGNLNGTASYATRAKSASYATQAKSAS